LYQNRFLVTSQLKNITAFYVNSHVNFIVSGVAETLPGDLYAYITLASGRSFVGRHPSLDVSRSLKVATSALE
jgi:hypothetical protein